MPSCDLRIASVTSCFGNSNCINSFSPGFPFFLWYTRPSDTSSLFHSFYSFLVVSDSETTSAKCGFKPEARLMRTMAPNTVSDDCNEAVFSLSRRSASSSVGGASVFEAPSLFGTVALARTSLHASAVSVRRFDSNGFARGYNLIRSAIASVAFTEGVAGGLRLKPSAFSCLLQ